MMDEEIKILSQKTIESVSKKIKRAASTDFTKFNNNIGLGADGTITKYVDNATTPINADAGDVIELDWTFNNMADTGESGVTIWVPSGWTLARGTDNSPHTILSVWHESWEASDNGTGELGLDWRGTDTTPASPVSTDSTNSPDGWAIMQLIETRPEGILPFEEVRDMLRARVMAEMLPTARGNWLDKARADANISIPDERLAAQVRSLIESKARYEPAQLLAIPTAPTQ